MMLREIRAFGARQAKRSSFVSSLWDSAVMEETKKLKGKNHACSGSNDRRWIHPL